MQLHRRHAESVSILSCNLLGIFLKSDETFSNQQVVFLTLHPQSVYFPHLWVFYEIYWFKFQNCPVTFWTLQKMLLDLLATFHNTWHIYRSMQITFLALVNFYLRNYQAYLWISPITFPNLLVTFWNLHQDFTHFQVQLSEISRCKSANICLSMIKWAQLFFQIVFFPGPFLTVPDRIQLCWLGNVLIKNIWKRWSAAATGRKASSQIHQSGWWIWFPEFTQETVPMTTQFYQSWEKNKKLILIWSSAAKTQRKSNLVLIWGKMFLAAFRSRENFLDRCLPSLFHAENAYWLHFTETSGLKSVFFLQDHCRSFVKKEGRSAQ